MIFKPVLFGNQILGMVLFFLCVAAFVYLIVNEIVKFCHRKNNVEKGSDEKNSDERIGMASVLGTRSYQQDRAGITKFDSDSEECVFGVLCDGMGGLSDGEKASEFCRNSMIKNVNENNIEWNRFPAFFKSAINELDAQVTNFRNDAGEKIHSGTTMVAAVVKGNNVFWSSIGDSRIYVFENGTIRRITRDHSYELKLNELFAQGKITREEIEAEPRKDALISFIGMGGNKIIDVNMNSLELSDGSIILLCSDGVTKILSDYDLERLLNEKSDLVPEELAKEICNQTTLHRRRGQDNTTAIIIKIGAERGKTVMNKKENGIGNKVLSIVSLFAIGIMMISVLLNVIGAFSVIANEPEENKEPEENAQVVVYSGIEEKVTGYPYGVIVNDENGNVYFSIEETENTIIAEDWRGRYIEDVKEELEEKGIVISVEEVYSSDVMSGMIIAQSFECGESFDKESVLKFVVVTENSTKIDLNAEVENFMKSIEKYEVDETDSFIGKNAFGCIYSACKKNSELSDEEKIFPYIESYESGDSEGIVTYEEYTDNRIALVVTKISEEQIVMPNVIGCTKEEVEEIISEAGITNKIVYAVDHTEGFGVTKTKPEEGKIIGEDYVIWIYFAPDDKE